jgi:protein TonB
MSSHEESHGTAVESASDRSERRPPPWLRASPAASTLGPAGGTVAHPGVRTPSPARPMAEPAGPLSAGVSLEETRYARLASRERLLLAVGLLASVGVHAFLFAWSPSFHTADLSTSSTALQTIQLPPDVKIPPPPQAIARPATPKVAATDVSPELTIAPTTLEANPASTLAPPPPAVRSRPEDRPTFIPYDVAPELLNRDEIERLILRNYPRALRDVGIGGTVILWAYVDTKGHVVKSLVKTSSGYPSIDEAALGVVHVMRFKPAINRDQPIAVWISQKVSMTVQR